MLYPCDRSWILSCEYVLGHLIPNAGGSRDIIAYAPSQPISAARMKRPIGTSSHTIHHLHACSSIFIVYLPCTDRRMQIFLLHVEHLMRAQRVAQVAVSCQAVQDDVHGAEHANRLEGPHR